MKLLPPSFAGYRRDDVRGDVVAGLTTAVMLIPQAMAYAMLAGLPPIVGLYASTVPVLVYALLGSSRELAVGPVAMVSLLVATGVGALTRDPATYLAYAVLLAAMVGVMQLAFGVFRLGILTRLLTHPVVSGFTTAAALIIGMSQLKHVLGVPLSRSHHVHSILLEAAGRLGEIHVVTFAVGAGALALLFLAQKLRPRAPRALAVVALGTVLVWVLGLDAAGVAIVGEVPAGLPSPSLPPWDLEAVKGLLPTAITISLVGLVESISVARAFARRAGYEIDPNRELVGLGAANLAASLFGGYPVTGGFSRTAVNAQAGAKSGLSSIVTAGVIGLTLLVLTPLFHFLPKAVLAAIIMSAVFGLVDLKQVRHLWQTSKPDLVLWVVTAGATLALGIEQGIAAGVGASLLFRGIAHVRGAGHDPLHGAGPKGNPSILAPR